MAQRPNNPFLVIVTGLSGAGNSTALKALADAGMYCIDNLPMELLPTTIDLFEAGRIVAENGLAICMDVRDRSFAAQFPSLKKQLAARIHLEVIFLAASPKVLAQRFSATRRKHPLLREGETLAEAIEHEIELLGPVEEAADAVYDTSLWSPQQLVRVMEGRLKGSIPARTLHLAVTSFGFKHGQLEPADMMLDMRFLENPYFVSELKEQSGLDEPVRQFVMAQEAARLMLVKVEEMLRFLLPLYYAEGKHYLRLGIGCTGGRHRSVAFAEEIGRLFLARPEANTVITVLHRDIDR